MNRTDLFLDSLYKSINEKINEEIIKKAKGCFLDFLGCTIAGSAMMNEKDYKSKLIGLFIEDGKSTVIGQSRKATLPVAALINGYLSHIAELDDGHRFAMTHTGATIFPALLAVAEKEKLSGEAILRGIIAGYEAGIKLGGAIQPSHKKKGFHVSGTCGTVAAAISIGIAKKMKWENLKTSIAAAVAGSAGSLEMIDGESELKPYNIGRASMDGLIAAQMGEAGFQGPLDPLGGKRGFLSLFADDVNEEWLINGSVNKLCIEGIYQKLHAACRHSHAPLEAALKAKEAYDIDLNRMERIEIHTYNLAIHGHDHREVESIHSAKMSIPFGVSVAMLKGKAGLNEFTEDMIHMPQLKELMKKVNILPDNELSSLVPKKRAAIAKIIMIDGREFHSRVDYPKGEPENPFSYEELKEKFFSLAYYGGKSLEEAKKIEKIVQKMEEGLESLWVLL